MMAVSTLVWYMNRALELGTALLCYFHFFPGVFTLVRGWVWDRGFGATPPLSWHHSLPNVHRDLPSGNGNLHPGATFSPSGGCAGMHELAILATALCQGQGLGLSQSCFIEVYTLSLVTAASALVGSSTGARGPGSGSLCTLGAMLGQPWQASQSPRPFSICCFCTVTESKQVYACVLQEGVWFLTVLQ